MLKYKYLKYKYKYINEKNILKNNDELNLVGGETDLETQIKLMSGSKLNEEQYNILKKYMEEVEEYINNKTNIKDILDEIQYYKIRQDLIKSLTSENRQRFHQDHINREIKKIQEQYIKEHEEIFKQINKDTPAFKYATEQYDYKQKNYKLIIKELILEKIRQQPKKELKDLSEKQQRQIQEVIDILKPIDTNKTISI